MDRPDHNNVKFFVGQEVEHTVAFGMPTLFVVGVQDIDEIQSHLDSKNIHHIYFGANQSFPRLRYDDANGWRTWENMIMPFLMRGYWCTLDIDVSCVSGLTEGPLCENSTFIPMISVKVPYVRQLGYNAVLKIDDTDFNHSNPGVWCHNLHDLQNRSTFTDWSKYKQDVVIK